MSLVTGPSCLLSVPTILGNSKTVSSGQEKGFLMPAHRCSHEHPACYRPSVDSPFSTPS